MNSNHAWDKKAQAISEELDKIANSRASSIRHELRHILERNWPRDEKALMWLKGSTPAPD